MPDSLLGLGDGIVNQTEEVSALVELIVQGKQFKEITAILHAKYLCYGYELNCVS